MIDTVKFLISIRDEELIKQLQGNLKRFSKENLKTGETEFEFFTADIPLGSYNRTVAVKSTQVPLGFFLEFSAPKYIKGNNVEMIYPHELPAIMEKIYPELCNYMNYQLPHFLSWPVYKLDTCYNWIFNSADEARYAVDFIKRIDYPRKKKYDYDTSVMFQGSAYTVKFYLKGAEFHKNDFKKVTADRAPELQAWANRILRFEVEFRKRYLQQLFGLAKVFVTDVADDARIEAILIEYLQKVFFYINPKTMTNEATKEILYANFSRPKATKLYQFHKNFYFDDDIKNMLLHGGMNRTTIYRYKKDLKRVGIGFSLPDAPNTETILERLVIPSSHVQFDLVDYQLPLL